MADNACRVWIGLAFSVFTGAIFGLEESFNVYAVALKQTFNFTQTEVELVSSLGLAGMGASLIEPFIVSTFGYRIGYFFTWAVTSGSAMLMWIAAVYKDIFKHWPILVCLFQFLMNLGQNAGSTRLTSTSIVNFPERHTGKLVGLGLAAFSAGKLFYGGIFQLFFADNLEGFFLAVTITQAVSYAVCYMVHRPKNEASVCELQYHSAQQDQEIESGTRSDETPLCGDKASPTSNTSPPESDPPPSDTSSNVLSVMRKSAYFHLTFWPSAVIQAIMYSYLNNITSMAYSIRLDEPMYLVYVIGIFTVITRILCGLLFDKFKSYISGLILLLTGWLFGAAGLAVIILKFTNISAYIVSIFVGIGMSTGLSIPCSVLALRFGQKNFPYIVGIFYFFIAIFGLLDQYLIGILYDIRISPDGFCYGSDCFFVSALIFLVVTVFMICVRVVGFILADTSIKSSSEERQ